LQNGQTLRLDLVLTSTQPITSRVRFDVVLFNDPFAVALAP
jgi:hypothetical protein